MRRFKVTLIEVEAEDGRLGRRRFATRIHDTVTGKVQITTGRPRKAAEIFSDGVSVALHFAELVTP